MHLGPDSVGQPAVLEPGPSGAPGAFDFHTDDAANRFAPGEWITVYCYGLHRSTSSHRMATSRPVAVMIHRRGALVRAWTISEPDRLRGRSAPRR